MRRFEITTLTFALCLCVLMNSGCSNFSNLKQREEKSEPTVRLKAIDQNTQAEACRRTAIELAAHEKDDHAIEQFKRARKLNPEIRGVSHPLAVLYDRQQQLDAAQREYLLAIEESPKNADVQNDYGYFLYSRGDYSEAHKHLERAIDLNPEHSKASVNLAMVFAAEDNYEKAFEHFEKALGPAAAHHNVGLLKLRAGHENDAVAHLQQAAKKDPSIGSAAMLTAIANRHTVSEIIPANYTE